MPAPLLAAATYFGMPRVLGYLADQATLSRINSLVNSGQDVGSDILLKALDEVPRKSALEQALGTIGQIYNANTQDVKFEDPSQEMKTGGYDWRPADESSTSASAYYDPATYEQTQGPVITRDLPLEDTVVFNTPLEDYLKYGGVDADSQRFSFSMPQGLFNEAERNRIDDILRELNGEPPRFNNPLGDWPMMNEESAFSGGKFDEYGRQYRAGGSVHSQGGSRVSFATDPRMMFLELQDKRK